MKATQSIFFVEVTDTYAGDANYTWVHRFKVHATTFSGAMRKVNDDGTTQVSSAHRFISEKTKCRHISQCPYFFIFILNAMSFSAIFNYF